MVQLVVLRGAGEPLSESALDGIRELPRRPNLGRVAALADRRLDRGLIHVSVHRAGDWSPLMVLGFGRGGEQATDQQRDDQRQAECRAAA